MALHPFRQPGGRARAFVATLLFASVAAGGLAAGSAALASPSAPLPSGPAANVPVRRSPEVHSAFRADVSPRLASLPPRRSLGQPNPEEQDNANPRVKKPAADHSVIDSVLDRVLRPLAMPAPIQNFDGMYNEYGPVPPDTTGDVGRNHYVQIVNSGFEVFSKPGVSLYGPANANTLFTGFGGYCEPTNNGDTVAL